MRSRLWTLAALSLGLACARAALAQGGSVAERCAAKGGKLEIFDTEGGPLEYCRLADRAAIEGATLLKGSKSKAARVFKSHEKLRKELAAREDAAGTAEELCELAGGKAATVGRKGAQLSACFFLDRSSIDAESLFEGPKRRPALAKLLK